MQFHQFLNQRKTDTRTLLIKQILVQQIFKTDKKGSFLALDVYKRQEVVTRHIRQKLEARHEEDIERKVLHFLPSTNLHTYEREYQRGVLCYIQRVFSVHIGHRTVSGTLDGNTDTCLLYTS